MDNMRSKKKRKNRRTPYRRLSYGKHPLFPAIFVPTAYEQVIAKTKKEVGALGTDRSNPVKYCNKHNNSFVNFDNSSKKDL